MKVSKSTKTKQLNNLTDPKFSVWPDLCGASALIMQRNVLIELLYGTVKSVIIRIPPDFYVVCKQDGENGNPPTM